MSDRFNFFDIYGYLLPGALLLILSLIPFWLLLGEWPPADLGTASLAITLAYITGHILYALSSAGIPSTFKDAQKVPRHPSDLLLEKGNGGADLPEKQHLSDTARDQLIRQIQNIFGYDVNRRSERALAFFLCRSYLIQKKAAAYAEQQNGMYALMRGVTASFRFASALYCGIAIGLAFPRAFSIQMLLPADVLLYILLLVLVLLAGGCYFSSPPALIKQPRVGAFWLLVFSMLCCGVLSHSLIVSPAVPPPSSVVDAAPAISGLKYSKLERSLSGETNAIQFQSQQHTISRLMHADIFQSHAPTLIFGMFILTACLSTISHAAFRSFAVHFAATVYRDFNALAPLPPPSHDEIASYAYYLYERDAKLHGNEVDYWLRAESELKSLRNRAISGRET